MLRRGTSGRSCSELHALRRRQVVPYEVSLASGHSLSGTAQHLKAQRRIVRKSGTGSLGRRLDGFDDAAQSGRPVRSPPEVARGLVGLAGELPDATVDLSNLHARPLASFERILSVPDPRHPSPFAINAAQRSDCLVCRPLSTLRTHRSRNRERRLKLPDQHNLRGDTKADFSQRERIR